MASVLHNDGCFMMALSRFRDSSDINPSIEITLTFAAGRTGAGTAFRFALNFISVAD